MAEESGSRWSQAVSSSGYDADPGQQTETSQDARNMAMLCTFWVRPPSSARMVSGDRKGQARFVDEHGREAMNTRSPYDLSGGVRRHSRRGVSHPGADRRPPRPDRSGRVEGP